MNKHENEITAGYFRLTAVNNDTMTENCSYDCLFFAFLLPIITMVKI